MWVTKIDHKKECLYSEGHIIENDKKLSGSLHVSEIDFRFLKETLSWKDYNDMTEIAGQIFYVEQFEDGTETIVLKTDDRTPEEIVEDKESAKKWADEMLKK